MILNASGRTDICAFYMDWFIHRIHEGYFDVRNPFYYKKISRIMMEDVDAIMFCTKNPLPLLKVLDEIPVPILLDVTITPYHKEIEPFVPDKPLLIEGIKKISQKIGKERITLRYDPIFLSSRYTVDYHIRAFEKLCSQLKDDVGDIVISFLDEYKNVLNNKDVLQYRPIQEEEYERLARAFSQIADKYGLSVATCFEKGRLAKYGLKEGACLSVERAFDMTGKVFKKWKARDCGCVEMADIGVYNTCLHHCKYCYANYDERQIESNYADHDLNSSLLIGHINELDEIKRRKR